MTIADDPQLNLQPTRYLESEAAPIAELARSLQRPTQQQTAVALFEWVRDRIRYDPYTSMDPAESYRATRILERGRGYCIQKAVLLAALGRAAGIPSRLGFADVRNHKTPDKLRAIMNTDLFVFHGYVEFFLGKQWVKATPAFDPETTRKANALPVVLDGTNDAMLHPVDPEGHPHIEYIRDRGPYSDLPIGEIQTSFAKVYASLAAAIHPDPPA